MIKRRTGIGSPFIILKTVIYFFQKIIKTKLTNNFFGSGNQDSENSITMLTIQGEI